MTGQKPYLHEVHKVSSLEIDALLFVNCARLSLNAPLLSYLPAADLDKGETPIDRGIVQVISFVSICPHGRYWYLQAPKGAAKMMAPIARVWQTSVQHPHGTGSVWVKCPNRVAKFLAAFQAGKMPHLIS